MRLRRLLAARLEAALVAVAIALLAGTGLLLGALRLAEKAAVVLGMLEIALGGDSIAGHLRVTREGLVLVDDLLRRAAHLAVGARALEHAVDDVAHAVAALIVVVVVVAAVVAGLVPGPRLVRWSHAVRCPPLVAVGTRRTAMRQPAIVPVCQCTCPIRHTSPGA